MGRMQLRALLVMLVLALTLGTTQAQMNWLPEVRGGVFVRGVDEADVSLFDGERITDANLELLFNAPDLNAWVLLGELRPHLGGNLGFGDLDSNVYAGLSWTVQVPVLPVFVEASAGAIVHSGLFSASDDDPAQSIGCGAGLRLAASAGLQLPLGLSLVGTLEHLPDFGACDIEDRAATNVGVRLGYRF